MATSMNTTTRGARWTRAAILLIGLLVPQGVLYGPSLVGHKILLPLDLLALPQTYLPRTPAYADVAPRNIAMLDLVTAINERREFAVREVRAGRLPLWNPYAYCGAPFLAANNTAVFSPYRLLDYAFPSPVTLAWKQLAKALVIGIGAYLFFRIGLQVAFWPAAIGAWCFPLCFYFIIWCGYPLSYVSAYLPWMLLAVAGATRRPGGLAGPALAALTGLVMASGQAEAAAHVLLAAGLYFCWLLVERRRQHPPGGLTAPLAAVVGGWVLGFALSMPQSLPTAEYLETSHRVAERQAGSGKRTPLDATALPQLVFPDFLGTRAVGSFPASDAIGSRHESLAAGYVGLLMTLVLAPLAFASQRLRASAAFWALIAIVALSPAIGVWGLAELFDLFPLRLLRNNRFVLVTGFAVVTLGVIGMDAVSSGCRLRRWWAVGPIATIGALVALALYRTTHLPPQIADLSTLFGQIGSGRMPFELNSLARVQAVHEWYVDMYRACAVAGVIGLGLWAGMLASGRGRAWMLPAIAPLLLLEMMWTAWGVNSQADPALYVPRIPALARLADRLHSGELPAGRITGWDALPASLSQTHWLRDVRGYDGADPAHLVRLLALAESQSGRRSPSYARTQWFTPDLRKRQVLALTNLRYIVGRGDPPPNARIVERSDDYWVAINEPSLPRVYVPERVEIVDTEEATLARLPTDAFNPQEVALVNVPPGIDIPPIDNAKGRAVIVGEIPSRVTISAEMDTPGMIVLSDLWYEGWTAYLRLTDDGGQGGMHRSAPQRLPIHRVNYAFRGVVVPPGQFLLEFRYEPRSFYLGLWLGAGSLLILLAWAWRARRSNRARPSSEG
jgi:hypothetical protein